MCQSPKHVNAKQSYVAKLLREMAGCLHVAATTTVMVTKSVGRPTGENRKVRIFLWYVRNENLQKYSYEPRHACNNIGHHRMGCDEIRIEGLVTAVAGT